MIPHLHEILQYAVKAPSGHNTQPWKFRTEAHFIHLYPDFSRQLTTVDPDHHELYISLGCALENTVQAAHAFGYNTNVFYNLDEAEPFVSVHIYDDENLHGKNLLELMEKRHVNRKRYNGAPVLPQHLQMLQHAAEEPMVHMQVVKDRSEISMIAQLVQEACETQFSDENFKEELLHWIRFNDVTARKTNDGIRSASMGMPAIPTALGHFIFRHMVSPASEAEKSRKQTESASALLIFSVEENTPEAWIKLGRSFERVALQATALNISHAHLNMVCELPAFRRRLQHMMHLETKEPLLLVRIGYASAMPASYRRLVEEMLIK